MFEINGHAAASDAAKFASKTFRCRNFISLKQQCSTLSGKLWIAGRPGESNLLTSLHPSSFRRKQPDTRWRTSI